MPVAPLASKVSLAVRADGRLRLAVVADTHSAPHPALLGRLAELSPDAILHAGDIGDLDVIAQLAGVAQVIAVRGNIDVRLPGLPDHVVLSLVRGDDVVLRVLLTHIAVYGAKLRADAARLARESDAALVVCGHSHVPLITRDRGTSVFNPGSAGPRRFHLPIVFGTLELSPTEVRLAHVDCETGQTWSPAV